MWFTNSRKTYRATRTESRRTSFRPHPEVLEERCLLSAGGMSQAADAYGQLPLIFEANRGQTDAQVNFLSRGSGYTLFLTPGEAVLALKQPSGVGDQGPAGEETVLHMQLVGANPAAPSVGLDAQAGTSNYLIGNDPSQWHTGIANYGRVEYQNVYPGIDVVYYGNQRQLEYDFIVSPGSDPSKIKLSFQGAEEVSLDSRGNLVLHTPRGDVVEHAPVVYQETGGVRQAVSGRYVLEDGVQVGFVVGAYDASKPLTIDPVLSYTTYLGGASNDYGAAIAVDTSGNAYITGTTDSVKFPTKNPFQPRRASNTYDAFVTKLNSTGTALVYSTYLGGSGYDAGTGIAVDGAGNAYVTGYTATTDFPTKNAFQASNVGVNYLVKAFVTKLNPAGAALLYSTYLGGSDRDYGYAIAVDGTGNAYVTGQTASANFPTKNALQPVKTSPNDQAHPDAFVAKIDPSQVGAASLIYSTFLDGSNFSVGLGIAVDGLSNAYVTGRTGSVNFPTTPGALQTAFGGVNDGFATKLNAAGSALVYSTFLGGSGDDRGFGIAVDGSGNAYLTGSTSSANFPITLGAYQATYQGSGDAFVTKLDAAGATLVYSTFLGGSSGVENYDSTRVGGIAVDTFGNAYVTGMTRSTNFPTTAGAIQQTFGGQDDAFVTQLNTTGSALVYSTYLGGNSYDDGYGIAVDASGNVYVVGSTSSTNFPTKNALQSKNGGNSEAFVTKIGSSTAIVAAMAVGEFSPTITVPDTQAVTAIVTIPAHEDARHHTLRTEAADQAIASLLKSETRRRFVPSGRLALVDESFADSELLADIARLF